MAAVSIYNVLRTVAQVQVAQAMAKVDGAIVTLPQVSPSSNKPSPQSPSQLVAQDTVSARSSPLTLSTQVQAHMTQTITDTVDRILSAAQRDQASQLAPNTPRQQAGPALRPSTPSVSNPQQSNAQIVSVTTRLPAAPPTPPVPVRAITLASLPAPEVIRSLGLVRMRPATTPTVATKSEAVIVTPQPNPMAQSSSAIVSLQPQFAKPMGQADPILPVVTKLLAQVAAGEITETQFVKTLIAQILTGRYRDQSAPSVPLPRPTVPTSVAPMPQTPAPSSVSSSPLAQNPMSQGGATPSAPQALRESAQAMLTPVVQIMARLDPSVGQPLSSMQSVSPTFSAFPHVLSELAVSQPVAMQSLASLSQVPPQFKDLAGLVAYYAAMLPGWPNPDAQRLKRPKDIPVPLMQLAQVVKQLSPEQQVALLSRMGMPLHAIKVLQKMLKDLDKKLNAKTVETFLAALLGTLSFVVDEVVGFFEDIVQMTDPVNDQVTGQERAH